MGGLFTPVECLVKISMFFAHRHQDSTSPSGSLYSVLNQSSDSCGQNSGHSGGLFAEAVSSETLKAESSGEIEEGLGGVELGETVTIDDSVEDGG